VTIHERTRCMDFSQINSTAVLTDVESNFHVSLYGLYGLVQCFGIVKIENTCILTFKGFIVKDLTGSLHLIDSL
jgi:hypothetical protein